MTISVRQLRRKILGDKYNAVIFKKGRNRGIYMVGGYVRDTLRGVRSQDRDFVIRGDINSFVREIRDIFGGTIVRFRKGDMVRLAVGGLTFDFSEQIGTMEEDLSKRDFTINAVAWTPEGGVIDLHQGIEDLEKNRIRMISESNLISDPLRLLRAYRFAAELGGLIENRTRDAIKTLHDSVENVSPERITLELFHLLNSKRPCRHLAAALRDGVLSDILSLSDKMLERNIRAVCKLEERLLEDLSGGIKALLDRTFSQNLTYKGLLCLELLLQGAFPAIPKIRMSSSVMRRVQLSAIGMTELKNYRSESKGTLFDIFARLKDALLDSLIVSGRLDLFGDYGRFTKIMTGGLLRSKDIMDIMGLGPCPLIGRIILTLGRAQFEGIIRSRSEATDFMRGQYR